MNASRCCPPPTAAARLARRLRAWLRSGSRDERYLAAATDHADLERRMRALERLHQGPLITTYNH